MQIPNSSARSRARARRQNDAIVNAIALQIAKAISRVPIALDGTIVGGTWDKTDGTAVIEIGTTSSIPAGDPNAQPWRQRMTLSTPMIGSQRGPMGGERVTIMPRESGWIAHFEHGTDDTPGAAAGEYVEKHRPSGATFAMRNDADAGDGKGSVRVDGAARHAFTTKGGLSRTSDDVANAVHDVAGTASSKLDAAAQAITHDVAGKVTSKLDAAAEAITHTAAGIGSTIDGLAKAITHDAGAGTKTIVDGAGRAIAHVAQEVGLGDTFANLPAGTEAIAKAHLQDTVNLLRSAARDDLLKGFAALAAAGVTNAAGAAAQLAGLLGVNVASASARVKLG